MDFYMDTQALKELLSSLSLEEKIGQLVQLPASFQNEGMATGPAGHMGIDENDLRLAGSYLSIVGAEKIKSIQREFVKRHPHHIPLLFMADIINGYRTVFPIPLAQGCTFDPELVERGAAVAAREAAASGVHVTFSPMADLVRDARWGRVMESTGEDPCLNGAMAAAMVRGYQGEDLKNPGQMASCLKHLAGYGAPEGGRDYNNVELSERTLREDYLPAYQAAVDAGCEVVMTSFNTLNRIPSAANEWLIKQVLRREMGFWGMVITDWNALQELLAHGIAADEKEAAFLAIRAGVDMDMTSPIYTKQLKKLVEEGQVPIQWIDDAVWRILTLKNKLGLFENPFKDASEEAEKHTLLCEENRKAARECAEKSFVLLKNEDHILPLREADAAAIAFMGPYVDSQLLSGAWSIFSDDQDTVSVSAALRENSATAHCAALKGCAITDPDRPILGFQSFVEPENIDAEAELQKAEAMAAKAKQVVLCLGEHRERTGEAASTGILTLPTCQLELLNRVSAVNPNVIVALFTGRPLDIRDIKEKAKAILLCWLPGTEGGRAVVHTLFGRNTPSGKLSMAFPFCVGQMPLHYNHMRTGRPMPKDAPPVRFFSRYQDIPNDPLYPFGFGLSYTEFSYSPVRLSAESMTKSDALHAAVTVTNTGKCTGTETVQLYIRDNAGSVTRPVRELKAFRKITLQPGESADVSFEITEKMLRFYTLDMTYQSEPGVFTVFIGPDSDTDNQAQFSLAE